MTFTIRRATPADARGIAEMHVRTWQIAYRDYFSPEYLARQEVFLEEDRLRRRAEALADPSQSTIVAEEDGRVVGFAACLANRDELGDEAGELGAIYVDPRYWDRGIGTKLIKEAEGLLIEAGYKRAILWTIGANQRSRSFYENRGWRFDGTVKAHPAGVELVRYAKSLDAPAFMIRAATIEDARAIAEVHMLARQAAYAHFFPGDYLRGLTLDYCEGLWRERLSPPDAWLIRVALQDQRLLGIGGYGRNQQGLGDEVGELLALHVHPGAWGRGIGTALIAAVEGELGRLGFKDAVLWVYEENTRARRFYESRGWQPEGTRDLAERGGAEVVQVRYVKDLETSVRE
ncbi:MAG: GNAT family N-acetyltransferase [Dehalococcoidia bacterium]|nr:GNAT family N-acetyltransferase [Dehalococcoidia bacterium]